MSPVSGFLFFALKWCCTSQGARVEYSASRVRIVAFLQRVRPYVAPSMSQTRTVWQKMAALSVVLRRCLFANLRMASPNGALYAWCAAVVVAFAERWRHMSVKGAEAPLRHFGALEARPSLSFALALSPFRPPLSLFFFLICVAENVAPRGALISGAAPLFFLSGRFLSIVLSPLGVRRTSLRSCTCFV